MIKKIFIENLFDQFNYSIVLKDGGVTILTGPNGFGKSTILKSLDALYKGDIMFFGNLEFSKYYFFDENNDIKLKFEKQNGKLLVNDKEVDNKWVKRVVKDYAKRDRFLRRISEDKWHDRRSDNIIKTDDLYEKWFGDYILSYQVDNNSIVGEDVIKTEDIKAIIDINTLMKEVSGEIRYIKEQRLFIENYNSRLDENQLINVIDDLPIRFKKIVNEVSNEYSYKANELDSTYPNRLFKTNDGITKEEYVEKMNSMFYKFEKLKKYDISNIKVPQEVNFLKEHAKALKVYFEDFDTKYEVFTKLIKNLDMFTEIINSRLKFKEILISREDGISIVQKEGYNKIPLNNLSSGEKQEIILFYELIFNIDHNVYLLIDEPEISLHIEWQLKFMDDLLRIANNKNLNVIVATHSPQIINNHWDIQIDLGEEYGK